MIYLLQMNTWHTSIELGFQKQSIYTILNCQVGNKWVNGLCMPVYYIYVLFGKCDFSPVLYLYLATFWRDVTSNGFV